MEKVPSTLSDVFPSKTPSHAFIINNRDRLMHRLLCSPNSSNLQTHDATSQSGYWPWESQDSEDSHTHFPSTPIPSYIFIYLRWMSAMQPLGCIAVECLVLKRISSVGGPLCIPIRNVPSFSASSLAFGIVIIFYFSHTHMCVVESLCGFNFHFPSG